MESVLIALVLAAALYWALLRDGREKKPKLEIERKNASEFRIEAAKSRERTAAFEEEAVRRQNFYRNLATTITPRGMISEFDLVRRRLDPDVVSGILKPSFTVPATLLDGTATLVRYFDPDDVDAAINADIYALCEAWGDEVIGRFSEAQRVRNEKLDQEIADAEAEHLAKTNKIKQRVDTAKAKLRERGD